MQMNKPIIGIECEDDGFTVIRINDDDLKTYQAERIVRGLVPEWLVLFLEKNAKYKRVGDSLGARGVFPDVHRKVGILKDRVWDGNESPGEPTAEVIQDLIGHLFLMLYMLEEFDRMSSGEMSKAKTGLSMVFDGPITPALTYGRTIRDAPQA